MTQTTTAVKSLYHEKETAREKAFESVWTNELDAAFSEVAHYYDRANDLASLGLVSRFRRRFVSSIEVKPDYKVLDVCAGANAIGIDLLKGEPNLDVHAVDRSVAMCKVGQERARQHGFRITDQICDVHSLPFPDNHFDVVTLEWAGRHLRLIEVFSEIKRVLKPGGHFYHCDMLRPANKAVEKLYYVYLTFSISLLGWVFRSGPAMLSCRRYFIEAIRMFYSAEELSDLLSELGYSNVSSRPLMVGMVAYHKACKP